MKFSCFVGHQKIAPLLFFNVKLIELSPARHDNHVHDFINLFFLLNIYCENLEQKNVNEIMHPLFS